MHFSLQGTLQGSLEPAVDTSFGGAQRTTLDDEAWVDYVGGWVAGADALFDELLEQLHWEGHRVHMYDKATAHRFPLP